MATLLPIPTDPQSTTTDRAAEIGPINYLGMAPNSIMQAIGPGDVSTASADYKMMDTRWDLIHDLRGGTARMREAGVKWLPMEEKESLGKYAIRLSRSYLSNHFVEAVHNLSDRPFSRETKLLGENSPDWLESLSRNVDAEGTTLTDQANGVLRDAIAYGKSHLFVDFTRMPENATLRTERELGAGPRIIHIPAADLLFWRSEARNGGERRLTEIRWRERGVIADGVYGDRPTERIRIVRLDSWALFEKQPVKTGQGDEYRWVLIDSGPLTLGEIPLATLYLNRTGFMTVRPTLEDLAWTQLAHFQSASEQRNLLRFARIGLLFGKGFTEKQVTDGIQLAPTTAVLCENPEADLKYVEHEGAAMRLGREDLESLEARMDHLSFKPIIAATGGSVSATGQAIDEARSQAALQTWARGTETVYEQALDYAAKWKKTTLPKKFKVDIFSDFTISVRARDDVLALLEARTMGEISRITLLEELQRRGLLSDQRIPAQEVEKAKEDGPAMKGSAGDRLGGPGQRSRDPEKTQPDSKPSSKQRIGKRGPDSADGHNRGK